MTYKIRILHCIETISSGGVEQTRLTLARGLDKDKYELKIICTWAGGPIADALRQEGVELIPIGSFKHPFEWDKHRKVRQVIRDFKPHIIHGAIFEGMTMAAIGGKWGKIPVVVLEETSDPQNRSLKANWLLRQFVGVSDKIIAISPNVKAYLINQTKVKRNKIILINNSVGKASEISRKEQMELRFQYEIKEKDIVIGFVGRLFNDHKRVTDLVEAITYINEDNLKVLIVGTGKDEDLIKKRIRDFNLENQFVLVGFQFDTSKYYHMMDIACFPSAREGFGLVAAEAMMHQLPVVATKVGGLQNVVVDDETGFLVPPFHPQALAEKIQFLIDDPKLRQQMGQAGHQRAMEHYSAKRYVREVEELYWGLLEAKGIRHCERRETE